MRRYTWLNLIIQKKQLEKKKRRTRKSVCLCLRVCSISQLWLTCRSFKIICVNFLSFGAEHRLRTRFPMMSPRRPRCVRAGGIIASSGGAEEELSSCFSSSHLKDLHYFPLNWNESQTHNCAFLEVRDLFVKWNLPLLNRINWDFAMFEKAAESGFVSLPTWQSLCETTREANKRSKAQTFFLQLWGVFFQNFAERK